MLIKQDLKTAEKGNGDGRREKGGEGWREAGREGEGDANKPSSSCVIKILCSRQEAILGDPTQRELIE